MKGGAWLVAVLLLVLGLGAGFGFGALQAYELGMARGIAVMEQACEGGTE